MSAPPPSAQVAAQYAVLGSPVTHSLSPRMQRAAFAAAGIDAGYEPLEVTAEQLEAVVLRLRAQRYAGWNVTTPLKEVIVPLLDTLSPQAQNVNAINVVRREADGTLTGHNTDGSGFVRALVELWDWRPHGSSILVLGSGPAARAIAYELRAAGASEISCWSRTDYLAAAIAPPPHAAVNLVVSTLPSGASLPAALAAFLTPACDVIDINYAAARSPLDDLPASRRSDGLPLLLHQGALSFEWWTGLKAPLAAMRAAISR
ncbi:MAG: shikimate dehydrogenase [Candidatus Eremiobacteraeota bacterium]|nr:shikimate dehydrogenase [Candidatus Eremiobacteraeota bacterium]